MGWWKSNCNGGIDSDNLPTGHQCGSLRNAIPNRDSTEDYYNGDAVADLMYIPIAFLKKWFKNIEPKPSTEQLTELFTQNKFDGVFSVLNPEETEKLKTLIQKTWEQIDEEYKAAWGRPAYPEERVYVCKFSFGGADRADNPKWPNWWDLRPNDLK
jgi:hypothetical protein